MIYSPDGGLYSTLLGLYSTILGLYFTILGLYSALLGVSFFMIWGLLFLKVDSGVGGDIDFLK